MPSLFEFVHSFLAGLRKRTREGCPEASFRIPIVALVSCDQDRDALTHIAARERWDLHLAESCEDAHFTASQLSAPVIVFDRDWPGAAWRNVVQNLASSAHQPCVILLTSVADEYLWQELIGCGGYDMLAKPLRAEDAARSSAASTALPGMLAAAASAASLAPEAARAKAALRGGAVSKAAPGMLAAASSSVR